MTIGHIIFIVFLILLGVVFANSIRGFMPFLPEL